MLNGRIDEMIRPQGKLSVSLITIKLTKVDRLFFENLLISKEVPWSFSISQGILNTIRCPCNKISSLEYWS